MRKLTTSAISLGLLLLSQQAYAFETEMLQSAGRADKRVNIIVVGDGYRAEDQTLLTQHAKALVAELWTHPAFAEYKQFFNVKLIHSISADDGAVNGNNPPSQATLFRSYFNCSGIDRLLCIGDTASLAQVVATDAPEYDSRFDVLLISVNDSKYGGAGGSYATASAHALAAEIAVHEIGHSFAGLADEYDYGNSAPSKVEFSNPNVTIQTVREDIKWNVWIDATTPIPTPESAGYGNVVGLFEGANYYPTEQYRPYDSCEMQMLGEAFCPVCTEALIWAVYDKVDPIETPSPASTTVTIRASGSQLFSYTGPQPELGALDTIWTLDGVTVGSNASYSVSGASLGTGQHVLKVTVRDLTTRVRRDPNNVLVSTYSWMISADPNGGTGGAAGAAGAGGTATGGTATGGTATGGTATGGTATGGTATGGTATGGTDNGSGKIEPRSDWGLGYCADVRVSNPYAVTATSWSVVVGLHRSSPYSVWNAQYSIGNDQMTATSVAHNKSIPPGASVTFGFCANAPDSSARPTLNSVILNGVGNGSGGAGGTGGIGTGGTGTGGNGSGGTGTGGTGTGGNGSGGTGTGGTGTGGNGTGGTGTGGTGTGGNGTGGGGNGVEPCVPAKTISGGQSGNFETSGAFCFRTIDAIHGWGCSNFAGRTLLINDVAQAGCGALPLPVKFNGYYYFEASAGSFPWASIYWW